MKELPLKIGKGQELVWYWLSAMGLFKLKVKKWTRQMPM